MKARHLSLSLLAATALSIPAAKATPLLWDFSAPPLGNVGTTTSVTAGGIPIVASGFTATATPVDLFVKHLGGDEDGMGLVNDPTGQDEITPGNFIQLNLDALKGHANLDVSFAANSTTGIDEWSLFLSNTAGSTGPTPNQTGMSQTPASTTIDTTGFKYLDVGAVLGNVLLHDIDSTTTPTPEPATLALLGAGLVGLGIARRGRRNRPSNES